MKGAKCLQAVEDHQDSDYGNNMKQMRVGIPEMITDPRRFAACPDKKEFSFPHLRRQIQATIQDPEESSAELTAKESAPQKDSLSEFISFMIARRKHEIPDDNPDLEVSEVTSHHCY